MSDTSEKEVDVQNRDAEPQEHSPDAVEPAPTPASETQTSHETTTTTYLHMSGAHTCESWLYTNDAEGEQKL